MTAVQFIMLGGFLGAGKTTAIARLARQFNRNGQNVVLVTNDQAHDLVDTQSLRAQGFQVGEVPGACFCCKFDQLLETIQQLGRELRPDVIIAEPVGSCTDLMATVLEPLRAWHDGDVSVGPLGVLLKPEHGRKILGSREQAGFSHKAAYIFLKQIEEAQVVALNKIDKLRSEERAELVAMIQHRFPGKDVLAVSAKTGAGFEGLADALCHLPERTVKFMDVDYDLYAEGEAELGWLNGTVLVKKSDGKFQLDDLALDVVSRLQAALERAQAEPVHLKILAQSGASVAVANIVDSAAKAELSQASRATVSSASMNVNARVIVDPLVLETIVRDEINTYSETNGFSCVFDRIQRFRPARPTPTHRFSN